MNYMIPLTTFPQSKTILTLHDTFKKAAYIFSTLFSPHQSLLNLPVEEYIKSRVENTHNVISDTDRIELKIKL